MMLAGGSFFAFGGNGQLKDCPLKGTPKCPLIKECKLKDTPDCPLLKKDKAQKSEATATVALAATVPSCCKKK